MMGECSLRTVYLDNTGIDFIYERVREKWTGKLMRDIAVPKDAHLLGVMKDGNLVFFNPSHKLAFDDELVFVKKI